METPLWDVAELHDKYLKKPNKMKIFIILMLLLALAISILKTMQWSLNYKPFLTPLGYIISILYVAAIIATVLV